MRIGLFGSSFDPIHFGHLVAAQDAAEQCGLDKVVLIPAARAPLKPGVPGASAGDRLAMAREAVAGDPRFEVSEVEISRGGTSYTIDTVREWAAREPGNELHWIIGADHWSRLPQWREPGELARLVSFIVLGRPGHEIGEVPDGLPGLRWQNCRGHLLEISSTEIRARVAAGQPIDFFVPMAVAAYIRRKQLYRTTQ